MSKVAELLQNPKIYASHNSRFARQETGSDVTKIVRKWFQAFITVPSPINANLREKLRHSLGDKTQCILYRDHEAFGQLPKALAVTFQASTDKKQLHWMSKSFYIRVLSPAVLKATLRWELKKMQAGRGGEAENGRKSVQCSRKPHMVKNPDQSKTKESRGQLLRSKGVGWDHSHDKKQESTWSYLGAWSAERKSICIWLLSICIGHRYGWVSTSVWL